jgi:glycosyltransferase involved in cell wall biosynthesis
VTRDRHIVFVHQTFSTTNSEGSGRANAFALAMANAGWRVSIVAGANSYLTGEIPQEHKGRLLSVEECGEYTIYRPWTYSQLHKSYFHRALYFGIYMLTSAIALLRVPRFDVIVGCSPPITVAAAALAASALRRATFVFEVRDLWPSFPIEMGVIRNKALITASRYLEQLLCNSASIVVTNSPGFEQHLRSLGVGPDRLTLIPNGVDIDAFRPTPPSEELRGALGLRGKFTVLYIGAHGPANDLGVLLSAARLLKSQADLHFLLIGDGKEKSRLEARARDEDISNVTFLRPQPKERMLEYIALADICFASLQDIPMFTTTYPNKLFDYLACGKPTLTTIDGVSRQVLEAAKAGLYVRHEPVEIAQGIAWAMNHPVDLHRMGERAREAAVRDWDRARFAEDFVAAVDRV